MNQREKEMILVKLQELTYIIQGITGEEATLFDHEEDNRQAECWPWWTSREAEQGYCEKLHISRYTPDAVSTTMNPYRLFNQQ